MDLGRRLCSVTPHEDIENGFPRQPIPYHIAIPDAGVDENTGLIFFIDGFGGHPIDSYNQKLRPHLANQYNCIVVNVEYFEIGVKSFSTDDFVMADDFRENFSKYYKVDLPDMRGFSESHIISSIIQWMFNEGVYSIDSSVKLLFKPDGCYQSFGLLSALDCISVLCELINEYGFDKKRLFLLGTSFGGYIAGLMGKLAPNTFGLIVDNSGFVEADLLSMIGGVSVVDFQGCSICSVYNGLWSDDPGSKNYIDEHHKDIRSLIYPSHIHMTKTAYFCAHSVEDKLVHVSEKVEFKNLRDGICEVTLDLVDKDKLDARLYKNLKHGMDASLKGIFEKAYNHYMSNDPVLDDQTDFDRESEYDFPCSNGYSYHIKFTKDDVKLTLHPPE